MTLEGSAHFGKDRFYEVQPCSMLGCMNVFEASRPAGKIGHGLFGGMG